MEKWLITILKRKSFRRLLFLLILISKKTQIFCLLRRNVKTSWSEFFEVSLLVEVSRMNLLLLFLLRIIVLA
uniref:Uncharacterized protein n=1 Tax=Acrobeloides nanus TaxID=290746 RepID=A0A914BXF5_9BILA